MKTLVNVLKTSSVVLSGLLIGAISAHAQDSLGNGAQNTVTQDIGAGIVTYQLPQVTTLSAIVGEPKSRLPIVDVEEWPEDEANYTPSNPGTIGAPIAQNNAVGTFADAIPFTTARVAVTGAPGLGRNFPLYNPVTSLPYRQTGKLLMRFDTQWFVCTASLVKRGVLITAAHCVSTYGDPNSLPDEVRWHPANVTNPFTTSGSPYGSFTAASINVPAPYLNGTGTCRFSNDVGCNNDIATVTLNRRNGAFAGQVIGGTYFTSWNGFGFNTSPVLGNASVASIHQLGYPVALDSGNMMIRTTSVGRLVEFTGTNGGTVRNVQIGSAQTGGSSGGPWLVNFGQRPLVTNPSNADLGTESAPNRIIGVTSWGFGTAGVAFASFMGQNTEFPAAAYGAHGAGNIGALMQATCLASIINCL